MKNIFANTFSRTEKIIISFFLALFIIPELLWSPFINLAYYFYCGRDSCHFPRENAIISNTTAYPNLLLAILGIQFLGLFFSFLFFSFLRKKVSNGMVRRFLIASLLLLATISLCIFLFVIVLQQVITNIQIGII